MTTRQRDILEWAVTARDHMGWYVMASRAVPLAVMKQLVWLGWMRPVDSLCVVCDDNGLRLEPERYRVGYEITPAGEEALRCVK